MQHASDIPIILSLSHMRFLLILHQSAFSPHNDPFPAILCHSFANSIPLTLRIIKISRKQRASADHWMHKGLEAVFSYDNGGIVMEDVSEILARLREAGIEPTMTSDEIYELTHGEEPETIVDDALVGKIRVDVWTGEFHQELQETCEFDSWPEASRFVKDRLGAGCLCNILLAGQAKEDDAMMKEVALDLIMK